MEKIKFDKSWLFFAAAAAIFLIIKITAADYSVSDENTYYKIGQLVASGQVPYRDFFFAHPPLQIYLYAIAFKLFGFNLLLLKLLSAVAVIATAAFAFAIVKQRSSFQIAAATTILLLFSYGAMLFSNFPTGAEFATAFITAALYLFIQKRSLASGVLVGLAAATSLLSVIMLPVLAAAAALLLKDKKALMRLLIGFAAVFVAVNGLFLLVAKGEFVEQAYLYHLKKPAEDADKAAIFLRVVKTNLLLFAAAAVAIISKNRSKVAVLLPLFIAAAYIAAFPAIKTSFNYYLLYAFPFLAIAGGYGLLWLQGLLTERAKLRQSIAVAAVAAMVVLSGFAAARQFSSYDFQDFAQAEEIAAYARSNSLPGQTIFGDDSTVPLLSLLSGREITLNFVDNNALRYASGATDLGETLRLLDNKIRESELKFIIIRKILIDKTASVDFGIATLDEFKGFVKRNCKLAKEFPLEWRGLVQTYEAYDCLKT